MAKELDFSGSTYLEELEKKFGKKILNQNGTLNRKELANIIYNDINSKTMLDKITFKYVVEETKKELEEFSRENLDYILIDAPLLFEAQIDEICDYVIAVIADEEIKMNRIEMRDGITKQIAQSRLAIQKDDEFFKSNSDFIIENNGTKKQIKENVERILEIIK